MALVPPPPRSTMPGLVALATVRTALLLLLLGGIATVGHTIWQIVAD